MTSQRLGFPRLRLLAVVCAALTFVAAVDTAGAQQPTPRRGGAPATPRPTTPRRGGPPPATPAKPAPAEVKKVEPPPAPDARFHMVYTAGDQKTDTVMFVRGPRKRYEFQEMILIDQSDQKRMLQVSVPAKTYLVIATDGTAPAMPALPGMPQAAPKPPGVINVTTAITDTTERKMAFGRQARHVKTVMDIVPMPGACDSNKQHVETDGWYIDPPPALIGQEAVKPPSQPQAQQTCADDVKATMNGDPKLLGYPIAYTTTMTGADGKPVVASMEVTELELTTLDAALFEPPAGFTAAGSPFDLSKALSDITEAKLVAADTAPPAAPAAKAPGVVRVGVPEFTNKTNMTVDTRKLRANLIDELTEQKIDAVPMAAAPPADLQKRAAEQGYDYVVFAEVTELKTSKAGRFGGLMKAASGAATAGRGGAAGAVAGAAGNAALSNETTEASLAIKLVQPDGKQKMSTNAKGKDGGGFNLKSGMGIAKLAGGMYMNMMTAGMFSRFGSGLGYGYGLNGLNGVSMLSNPSLYRMQTRGLGATMAGTGIDMSAGAASYLMQSAVNMDAARALVGTPGQAGPSYEESLGEAVQNTAKAVQKAVQK
ncbi:MAG TPA: hypothetical protein VGQ37_11490 [Vicinamibacterales bacterium]|jgi:hypothetical protein|nr:hypothetical protein [Vicinamibacterales bacterium]